MLSMEDNTLSLNDFFPRNISGSGCSDRLYPLPCRDVPILPILSAYRIYKLYHVHLKFALDPQLIVLSAA
jgi:hypothetical protein